MLQEEIKNIVGPLEALLFIFGEPLDSKKIADVLKTDEEKVKTAAKELSDILSNDSNRGIVLIENSGKYMLATKPQYSALVEKFITDDLKEDLSPASLETLSIIAYFGPATRAQIDYLRGVNSSYILRNLLIRGLINRKSKGNAFEYEVSFDFLKFMGIDNVEKMPQYQEYQKLKEQYFSPKPESENFSEINNESKPENKESQDISLSPENKN